MMGVIALNVMILGAICTGLYLHFQRKHLKRLEDNDLRASLLLHEYYNMRHGNFSADDKFKFAVNFDREVDQFVKNREEDHGYVGDNVKLLSDYKHSA